MDWSSKQYSLFEKERTRPVHDLINALPDREIQNAIDLGCGPGNSTEILVKKFPNVFITGIDSSEDMLVAARKRIPSIQFKMAHIQDTYSWSEPEKFDVILANASLQWVSDHQLLYPKLIKQLKPGGHLAIQTPDNLDEPAHRLMREIANDAAWSQKLHGVKRYERHSAEWYFSLLQPLCKNINLWRTTYYHLFENSDAIIEWFKGSSLRFYLDVLDENERIAFLESYKEKIKKAYQSLANGGVLLAFPRLFIIATR